MSYCRGTACLLVVFILLGVAPPVVAGDDDVKAKVAAAGGVDKYDADAVVVLETTDVLVRPNGIGTARNQKVTKVLRDAGIRGLAVQRLPFDPHTNRLEVVAIRVYRAGGEVEEVPAPSQTKQPQTASGIFWPTDQYLVTVPGLAVGDAVETITEMTGFNVAYLANPAEDMAAQSRGHATGLNPATRQQGNEATGQTSGTPAESNELNAYGKPLKPPVPGNWHDEVHFWSEGYPIIEKRYTVRLPKDKPLQFEVYNGDIRPAVTMDGDQMVYAFEKKDITPVKSETHMEPWPNVAPKLLLATLPTWEDKARWLYEVSEPQFEADDAIRVKVAEVTAGLKTDEEKYTALNHWVAENIRYAGTSRGMCEGYTIHAVRETFHDRCGVCKDKAGMLVGMLRVAGFDSYLVMTMARQRVDRIPADQFNHAVTCIRKPDGSLTLLDPTWMPKSRDNWSTLEPLQHVVYGLPEGKELSQSPYFPPEDCQATWRAESVIDADNGLSGSLDFTAVGAPEGRLRRSLAGLPPAERGELFDATFQRLSPNARVTRVECTDPVDFSGPLKIECGFRADDFAVGTGGRRYLKLPMMQTIFGDKTMADLFGDTGTKERKYGIKLTATRLGRFEETIELPPGWKVVDQPKTVGLDGPSAGLHFKMETTPGRIHYTCDLVVKHWVIPPNEYANFKEVIEKFEELTGRVIACELEGDHAQR